MEDFDHVYRFELLETEHQEFVDGHSKLTIDTSLDFLADKCQKMIPMDSSVQPIWMVVHTTYQEELQLLIDHARDVAKIEQVEPKFVILSDVPPTRFRNTLS